MKTAIFILLIAIAIVAAGCAKEPAKDEASSTPNYTAQDTPQADGSTLSVTEANGVKSEVRTFPQGDVIQVSRATRPDGRRHATVKMRDGRSADLQDRSDIDRIIEMTSAEIAAAALKVLAASAPAPAKDKP